jgi:tetratricopeptide (TPR) repeat protein
MASPLLPGATPPGLGHRIRWWWRGRDWKTFALASPAVLVGLGVLVLIVVCATRSPREIQARYLTEGKGALQAKEYPRALTCYERVAPTADEPDAYYRLALAADAVGDRGRALALMRRLTVATADKPGYGPAHFWLARQHLMLSNPKKEDVDAARAHLVQALTGDLGPDAPAANGLLGKIYFADNRLDDAERCLKEAVKTIPLYHLDLARLYGARNNRDRARQEAELAVRFFRDRAKTDLTNHTARLAWADATACLEDFQSTVQILEEGQTATRDPLYPTALAKVYVAWHDFKQKQQKPDVPAGELLTLLDKGLSHDATNRDLLNRLLDHLRVGGPDADKARETLTGLLARGTTARAHVHFALAVDAHIRKDGDAEKLHLEMALAADPKAATVANNLAVLLLQFPRPDDLQKALATDGVPWAAVSLLASRNADLDRALATANVAVAQDPTNPSFLDTRGHIHLALGHWKDAAKDLEAALALAPEKAGLQAGLAKAYENLGQRDLAAKYRHEADARKAPVKP